MKTQPTHKKLPRAIRITGATGCLAPSFEQLGLDKKPTRAKRAAQCDAALHSLRSITGEAQQGDF